MASLMYGITSGTLKKIEIPNYLIYRVFRIIDLLWQVLIFHLILDQPFDDFGMDQLQPGQGAEFPGDHEFALLFLHGGQNGLATLMDGNRLFVVSR